MIQVPTDNLYKFCAISGVIILGLTFFYLLSEIYSLSDRIWGQEFRVTTLRQQAADLEDDIEHQKAAQAHLSNELGGLDQEISSIENRMRDLRSGIAGGDGNEAFLAEFEWLKYKSERYRQIDERLEATTREIIATDRQFRLAVSELEHSVLVTGRLFSRSRVHVYSSVPLLIIGFLLASFGFVRWYQVIQKPQEALLRKQLLDSDGS